MVIAVILFAMGFIGLVYALGIGIYWAGRGDTLDKKAEDRRAERDERLHEDMQGLIKEIRRFNKRNN